MNRISEETNVYRNLEDLIDANGLCEVLDALARICIEKSEHVLTSYDDKATARAWDNAHKPIMMASAHPSILRVSE